MKTKEEMKKIKVKIFKNEGSYLLFSKKKARKCE